MPKRTQKNPGAPFQTIREASRITGLSMCFLRKGCIDGSVPHVNVGCTYMVNIPALLKKLGVSTK
jgi:hypothetical protein